MFTKRALALCSRTISANQARILNEKALSCRSINVQRYTNQGVFSRNFSSESKPETEGAGASASTENAGDAAANGEQNKVAELEKETCRGG
jgi:hypothetical protein